MCEWRVGCVHVKGCAFRAVSTLSGTLLRHINEQTRRKQQQQQQHQKKKKKKKRNKPRHESPLTASSSPTVLPPSTKRKTKQTSEKQKQKQKQKKNEKRKADKCFDTPWLVPAAARSRCLLSSRESLSLLVDSTTIATPFGSCCMAVARSVARSTSRATTRIFKSYQRTQPHAEEGSVVAVAAVVVGRVALHPHTHRPQRLSRSP